MDTNLTNDDGTWVPSACTLPTTEQPLRRRELDALLAEDVLAVVRMSPTQTRLDLLADPDAAARAASLATKETGCCSFFAFDLRIEDGTVALHVGAALEHEDVIAALSDRAEHLVGGGR